MSPRVKSVLISRDKGEFRELLPFDPTIKINLHLFRHVRSFILLTSIEDKEMLYQSAVFYLRRDCFYSHLFELERNYHGFFPPGHMLSSTQTTPFMHRDILPQYLSLFINLSSQYDLSSFRKNGIFGFSFQLLLFILMQLWLSEAL